MQVEPRVIFLYVYQHHSDLRADRLRGPNIRTSRMNTQQFRMFFRLRALGPLLVAALSVLFLTTACEDEGETTYFDVELIPSTKCKEICTSGRTCFEDTLVTTRPSACNVMNCA